jgi:hypothetical protein
MVVAVVEGCSHCHGCNSGKFWSLISFDMVCSKALTEVRSKDRPDSEEQSSDSLWEDGLGLRSLWQRGNGCVRKEAHALENGSKKPFSTSRAELRRGNQPAGAQGDGGIFFATGQVRRNKIRRVEFSHGVMKCSADP